MHSRKALNFGLEKMKFTKLFLTAAILTALVWTLPTSADEDKRVYRWKDKTGASHYGDRVPPEYAGNAHAVLNEHGVEIKTVAGELTPEQLAVQRERAKAEAEAAEALRQAAIRDKVLLSTYLSVDEIEALRDRRVELLAGQLRITQKYLDNLRGKLLKLEREAQRYTPYSAEPDAQPIDEKLARELSETLNSIILYEKNLAKSRDETKQVQQKFAADIKRFRELQGLTSNN